MMLNYTLSLADFNKVAFLKDVQTHLRELLIKGMRAFLVAAIPRIPVRTGFARSAFLNLEDIAGRVSFDKSSSSYRIQGTRGGRSTLRNSREYYTGGGSRVLKTSQSGRQFATPANQIMDITGAKLASGRSAFYFKFTVNITYVDLLDRSVWGAFKAGDEAMTRFLKGNINTGFPQVGKYLIRKQT